MKVKVKSVGAIRQVLGAPELELTLPDGATFRELLIYLAAEKGEKFAPYAADPGEDTAYAPLRVLVNGRDVIPGQRRQLVLSDGDEVLMFLPIAGG